MSTFETVRENAISAEDRFRMAVEAKKARNKNLGNLATEILTEGQKCASIKEMEELDEACAAKEQKIENLDKMKEACASKRKKEGKIAMESKLVEQGKKEIMEMVLFEMVYNAYVADEDFKESFTLEMFETYKQQMAILEAKCAKKKKSKFVEEVENIVEEVCKKAAKRITKEDEEMYEIDFNLNNDEEKELDDKLAELDKDQIEKMVKDKVVTVVKDEKEQNIKKAELIEEIDNELAEITSDKEEEEVSVEESFRIRVLNKKKTSIRNNFGDTLLNSIMMETSNTLEKGIVTENVDVTNRAKIMDTVLVESLLKYTVLEMANTLGLYEFTKYDIDQLTKHFTFSK